MANEEEKIDGPDFNKIGLFKEMSYLEGHVPLGKVVFNESSKKGKQMVVECTKTKNGTQVGYFEKPFPRVFEGEAYADPIRARRLDRLAQAALNRHGEFKYTSPTKKTCGKGSYYGTFANYGEKMEYFSSLKKDAEIKSPPRRNFLTNPAKKGSGYGYADVTINKFPPHFLEEELQETSKEPPPRPEPRPFKPYKAGLFQQEFFDPNPYVSTKIVDVTESMDEEKAEDKTRTLPFRAPGPTKKDGGMKDGCLNKFPAYVEEPYLKKQDAPRGVKHYVNEENKMFRPVPGPKPYPIRSIIDKNTERKVTPLNYNTIKGVVYGNTRKKE